jgi:hypothetical protein
MRMANTRSLGRTWIGVFMRFWRYRIRLLRGKECFRRRTGAITRGSISIIFVGGA